MLDGGFPSFRSFTADQMWRDEADLTTLCAARPIHTDEAYQPNGYYGHAAILREYAGLPDWLTLKVAVPHGVESEDYEPIFARRERVPLVTYGLPTRRQVLRDHGIRNLLRPIAYPYVYLLELLPTSTVERAGTIFFPHHSGLDTKAQGLEVLAERLATLPPEYHPVTVCLYFTDVRFGHGDVFEAHGQRVVSSGHSLDPYFLARFHHLCAAHRFAASNHVSSPLFYAIKSGCDYVYIDGGEPTWVNGDGTPHLPRNIDDPRYQRTMGAMRGISGAPRSEQLAFTDDHLGTRYVRSPAGLRRFLLSAEVVDKTGLWFDRQDGLRVQVPCALRRAAAWVRGRPEQVWA
jgi:hypothetical protein